MDRLVKFWSLPRRERDFFCEAGILLLLSNLSVKTIAFRHIESFLRRRWNDGAPGVDHADDIKLVKRSLSRAANLLSSKSPCLSLSIAEFIMLRRRGIPAVIYMGVKFSEDSLLVAHAWVRPDEVTNGNSENSAYVPLVVVGQEQVIAEIPRGARSNSLISHCASDDMIRGRHARQNQLDIGVALMSGIAAVLNFDGSAVPQSEVERMADVLKPYGPDRQKILTRGSAAFVVCLHHLAPEDLFERQPVQLANRFVMLFDGRIDNRSELSSSLGITAPELESMPDSVIALRLFDRWGERAFERIVGDFAIIVMDLQEGSLICARDHMGLRVLHYHRSPDRFAVATTPEALFALNWVPRIMNKDYVGDTLVMRGLNGATTYYQEIFRVLPGCIVRVRGGKFSKDRFWDPENIADVRFKSDHEYVEAFQECLDAAVKARLRSRRAPCALITGGLNSSSIAVVAADMLAANGSRLNTFTAVPEVGFTKDELRGKYFDETPYVRQIAEANPNLVPHFIPPSKGSLLKQIADQIRLGGTPAGSMLNGLWVMDILGEARSAGHDVMLGGEMGNITMSYNGYGLFIELLLAGRWIRLFGELASSGYRWKSILRQHIILPIVPAALFHKYKQWRRRGNPSWYDYSAIHPEFAARSGVVDRAAREYLPLEATPRRDVKLARINDFHCYCETADWVANIRASFGVDYRMPAFDRQLVEFCIGIPEDQYFRKGCDRWLIRRAMKGRLPNVVLYNKKGGPKLLIGTQELTRERTLIAEEVKRLALNVDVASIVDLERLTAILEAWPEREPPVHSPETLISMMIPNALGAAYFIENVTGANYRQQAYGFI